MLQILRNTATIATVSIDEETLYSSEHMGMDKIEAVFDLPSGYAPAINDYVEYDGREYKIKHATGLEEATGRCTAIFYGLVYDLYDVPMSHLGRTRFSYTGTPLDLLGLLVDNLNAWFGGGWSVGDVEAIAEPETLPFDEVNCRQALTDIAETFKLEWQLDGRTIHLKERVGTVYNHITLEYGKGLGLQMISREPVDSSFATAWKFYGGSKNLPAGYRAGMDRITSQEDEEYYETNVPLYGRKGGSVTFEDVYPHRTAEVETTTDNNAITDSTIDFDIADSYITDGGAKIVFKTGDLGGNEFVITGYDHSTKTIHYGTNKDEDTGYELPNDTRFAQPGDLYTLIGIEMPSSYVAAAEAEVLERGIAHALQHNHPPVKFPLLIDEKYIREMGFANKFTAGDSFRVFSASLGVNAPMRLQTVSWPLVNPCLLEGEISDILLYTQQERLRKDVKQNGRIVSIAQRSAVYARRTADEIANAAIIHQFKRTYVGERAVMTGVFVAGNPEDGEVAGINGTGSALTEVRFWAGAEFATRDTAPFRVQQDGKAFMTAAEIRDGCKVGSFEIQGGTLRTSDYSSGGPSGVLISDQGISSRNAGASLIPGTTGVVIEGSFFGSTDAEESLPTSFFSPVSAGVIGVKWSELTQSALMNLYFCRGVYGSFVTSLKNVGGEFKAIRWSDDSAGTEQMTLTDHMVIVQASRTAITLPDTPDHGMIVRIKNARDVSINVEASGTNAIIDSNNSQVTTIVITSGQIITLIYHSGLPPSGGDPSAQRWLVIDKH